MTGTRMKLLIVLLFVTIFYTLLTLDLKWYLIRGYQLGGLNMHRKYLKPFQPEVTEDFPTVSGRKPRIPHIIHQTYKSTLIPSNFANSVQSFVEKNPNWTYYFWTDESGRELIKDRHPNLLDVWDNYREPISRVEALKYIILYEFGGIYVDIDFDCLRPLDRVTMKYSCIFPPEPFEQTVFQNGIPYSINNAIMMCRPKHPFLKLMIAKLAMTASLLEQVDIAGPPFVTFNFILYNNITDSHRLKKSNDSNSPYFYKGELKEDDINAVYVPNTVYFMDTLDRKDRKKNDFYQKCKNFDVQPTLVQRACSELFKKGLYRQESQYTFTHHHWYRLYKYKRTISFLYDMIFGLSFTELSTVVPKYKIYPDAVS